MQKRWNILQVEIAGYDAWQKQLRIHPILCAILQRRGIRDLDQAMHFFNPRLEDLHSPWLMKDMEKAVERIIQAFCNKEKILVFGDYDVDGTTAVACMVQFLGRIYTKEQIDYYIPHRYREGYGISEKGILFAMENEFTLIISLDCGIRSSEYIAHAKEQGIDFIVCDHHLPDDHLPPAAAILSPKQPDCTYPYKDLCGCGVGFKLITALSERLELPAGEHYQYLDLVATAIAADIVPVDGENRILAYHGLKRINSAPNNGIKAMIQMSGLVKALRMTDLVFIIAPRINAIGRMDDARTVVRLFTTSDKKEALVFADMLHTANAERRTTDSTITVEALALLENDTNQADKKSIVLYQEHWHKGVIGIVASRLTERYARPAIILTRSGDTVSGSARSFSGFNMYEAIHACRQHLVDYGGHPAAAGFVLQPDQVEAFIHKFEEVVSATIGLQSLTPELDIDGEITFADIHDSFFHTLGEMEPFGPENPQPVFIARHITDRGFSKIVKEQHIRFYLSQYGIAFKGIGYNLAGKFELLANHQPIDIVFVLEKNEWNGQKTLQLKILDFKRSEDTAPY